MKARAKRPARAAKVARVPSVLFDWRGGLKFAEDHLLRSHPPEPWIERPEAHGKLICQFALPPQLLKPQNYWRHRSNGEAAGAKDKLFSLMEVQFWAKTAGFGRDPLPGRPQVLCARLTCIPTDASADWAKHAVDQLCCPTKQAPKRRLSLISEDNPRAIDLHQWWEPVKKRVEEVCWIGVFEGRPA